VNEHMFYPRRVRVEYREEPCRTALNRVRGMPFRWSLNPYAGCAHRCTFCYVRAFEARADRPSDDRYGRSIRVKVNVADVLRRELSRASWSQEEVTIGAATDPYQPAEGRYRLTRACIRELASAETPFSIVTRGPLVVRDVDVLTAAARCAGVGIFVSLPTLDERVWRTTEPGTASPARRLDVVRRLSEAGLRVGVALAPILPGLSDHPASLAATVRAARAAGAGSIWAEPLRLGTGIREHFLAELAREWPEELARYEQLFGRRDHAPARLRAEAKRVVREAAAAHGTERHPTIRPRPRPTQLSLPV
jgi:DNA repair photolyase